MALATATATPARLSTARSTTSSPTKQISAQPQPATARIFSTSAALPVFTWLRKSIFNSSARRVVTTEGRAEIQPTLIPSRRSRIIPSPSWMLNCLNSESAVMKIDPSVSTPSTSQRNSFTRASLD